MRAHLEELKIDLEKNYPAYLEQELAKKEKMISQLSIEKEAIQSEIDTIKPDA